MAGQPLKDALNVFVEALLATPSGKKVNFTAADLMEAWEYFDMNKDGVLDGEEYKFIVKTLKDTLKESYPGVESANIEALLPKTIKMATKEHITIQEAANSLNEAERFLFLFRKLNNVQSSFDFMKVWREYDVDGNGILDRKELKSFLGKLLAKSKANVTDEQLSEFADTLLRTFDANNDGNFQLSEMTKLLPVKQNLFKDVMMMSVPAGELDKVFDFYDADHNGVIEGNEFEGLVKDILDMAKNHYEIRDLEDYKARLLKQWDENSDGKLSKSELKLMLAAGTGKLVK